MALLAQHVSKDGLSFTTSAGEFAIDGRSIAERLSTKRDPAEVEKLLKQSAVAADLAPHVIVTLADGKNEVASLTLAWVDKYEPPL